VEEELRVKNNRIAELESLVKLKEENGIQIVKLPGIFYIILIALLIS